MKLKAKDMDIATGGIHICILHENDALKLDLHHGDRVKLKKRSFTTSAIVDIAESSKAVKPGSIGLFEEVLSALKAKHDTIVEIFIAKKPIGICKGFK